MVRSLRNVVNAITEVQCIYHEIVEHKIVRSFRLIRDFGECCHFALSKEDESKIMGLADVTSVMAKFSDKQVTKGKKMVGAFYNFQVCICGNFAGLQILLSLPQVWK